MQMKKEETAIMKVDKTLDCKGLACPMPIVKTKKAMEELQPGEVIEVQATDKGSLADLQGWAKNTGHHYLGTLHEGEVLKHYLRKANPGEAGADRTFPHTITAGELQEKLGDDITIIDVREPAEYAFYRIPGAKSIPLGVLESRLDELNPEAELYVICRSGNRSDLACQLLAEKGFKHVKNVVEGMNGWAGPTENGPAL